ncbi:uncharacterized protein K02A2.6-like [Rhagoletis pomonella]|uniref:uncharacterized protein K02A2.6-like n=1 Tax=Rhagoletis pomonella TaxID=28610 RepID=UPI00177A8485|nr:uncharacterized protein K02A2.6-like [Rhagoletis pomonella]
MPFGISSAPGIFQRFMEQLIAGIPGCAVYLDDVIVTGENDENHVANVRRIFQRLEENGLRCRPEKCTFASQQIEYVGHIIDANGIKPSTKRLEAIRMMPRPKNVRQVEAFIGKINYYNKFIPNFSAKASALNILRRQGQKFEWGEAQDNAFTALKDDIITATQLVHHNDKLPIILATDASKYGLVAVISHRYPDGSENPIAFASKTLNKSQINYSQVEKEALSIVFGVTRFHQYLYGRRFELTSDHQPLVTIFHPHKKLPVATLHRLQRWAIFLQAYDYTIRYKNTAQHANADALSRLPMGEDLEFDYWENKILNVYEVNETALDTFPISSSTVSKETEKDVQLQVVKRMIQDGWPHHLPESHGNIKSYCDRRLSLSLQKGVVLLQTEHNRVVVPATLQPKVLAMLHEGHWGQTRMKQISRRYVWFPKIDEAIERLCKTCAICATTAASPKQHYSSWPPAAKPWEIIHIDFAGPFFGSMWLIIVDSLSKFPYTIEMSTTTSTATISALQKVFAIEGLPETIVSDNGTQFTSWEFQKFCELNAITHLTTAPFHPASNGLAERFVRIFKEAFGKEMKGTSSKEKALCKYLATYRSTPNPITGKSPAEILHGRQPRTLLSALFPNQHVPNHSKSKFCIGQEVQARNFSGKNKWITAKINQVLSRMMYNITTPRGIIRRHQNQIRRAAAPPTCEPVDDEIEWDVDPTNITTHNNAPQTRNDHPTTLAQDSDNNSNVQTGVPTVRRSERPRKQTVRFQIPSQ